jgi:hypothetical protein
VLESRFWTLAGAIQQVHDAIASDVCNKLYAMAVAVSTSAGCSANAEVNARKVAWHCIGMHQVSRVQCQVTMTFHGATL